MTQPQPTLLLRRSSSIRVVGITTPLAYERSLFGFAAFMVLGLLVPLLIVQQDLTTRVNPVLGLVQTTTMLVPAGFLSFLIGTGQSRPMLATFALFSYAWMGVASLEQFFADMAPWPILVTQRDLITTQVILLLSYLCLGVGGLIERSGRSRVAATESRAGWTISTRRLGILIAAAIVITPVGFVLLGGFPTLWRSRDALTAYLQRYDLSVSSIIVAVTTIPVLIAFLALWKFIQSKKASRQVVDAGLYPLLGLLGALNLLVNNPIANPRFWIGTIVIAVIFTVSGAANRIYVRLVVVGGVVGSVLLFPYAAYFRYADHFQAIGSVSDTLASKADYDAFQMIEASVGYTSRIGFTWGNQLLGALGFWLPRSAWQNKPTDTGSFLATWYGLDYTNLSGPAWAEAWINFGWFGVVVAFVLIGWLVFRLDRRFIAGLATQRLSFATVLVPVVAGYSFILLRGSLLQAMARLVIILLVFLFIAQRERVADHRSQEE